MTSITVVVPAFQVSYEEVDVTEDMLVRDLKAELEVLTDLPIGKQRLYHSSRQVFEDDKTLGSYDIEEIQRSPLHLVPIDHILIFVTTLTGKTLLCWVPSGATVSLLKEEVKAIGDIPIDEQLIVFANQLLEDDRSLSEYNISEGSTLKLAESPRGGGDLSAPAYGHRPLPAAAFIAFAGVCREWDGNMYSDGRVTGLSLSYGKVVIVTQKIDGHWVRGRHPGGMEEGVFPASFVEILEYTNEILMLTQGDSAPFPPIPDDEYFPRPPPNVHEEPLRARELQSAEVAKRAIPELPPFKYPPIRKKEFIFPLPDSSFIQVTVACESPIIPQKQVNVGVNLFCHTHDSIFVSSIHLTIKARGSEVSGVRPDSRIKSDTGKYFNVKSISYTGEKKSLFGKLVIPQPITMEIVGGVEWKTDTFLQLDGTELIPAQISGNVVQKNAFWDIKTEITPARFRSFSGAVWDGMEFVLDRYSTELDYSLTVDCYIKGKHRIIKSSWWKWW